MARKCFKQQYRLYCELNKIFSEYTVCYDKIIKLTDENNIEQKIEIDLFIENFFTPNVHLFIENDGYLWHKDKREKDLYKTNIIVSNRHHIIRTRDDRLESLGTDNEFFYNQSKDFLPYIIIVCQTLIKLLKTYDNTDSKISLLEKYITDNQYINNDEFYDYYNTGRVPNSLLDVYPEHAQEYSEDNKYKSYAVNCGSNEKYIWNCLSCQNQYKKTVAAKIEFGCEHCRKIKQQNESKEKLIIIFDKIKDKKGLTQSDNYFLQDKRQAKFGRGNGCVFYPSDQELADTYENDEIKNIFNLYDPELESNYKCTKYCDILDKNEGKHPNKNSKIEDFDINEIKELINWRNRKLGILKNGIGVFYPTDFNIAKQRGYEFIFDLAKSDEELQNELAEEIGLFYKNNKKNKKNKKRKPLANSQDGYEAKLGRKIGTLMKNINCKESAGGIFYDSSKNILKKYGCYDLFFTPTNLRKINESNKSTSELIKFIITKRKMPKQNALEAEERKHADFLNKKRRIKAGKIKGFWHDSDQEIAERYNLGCLFEQGFVLPNDYNPEEENV